jgi:hypothetical protein
MNLLFKSRSELKHHIINNKAKITNPMFLSELMELQNKFKNEVSLTLDQLMQADLDNALEIQRNSLGNEEITGGKAT